MRKLQRLLVTATAAVALLAFAPAVVSAATIDWGASTEAFAAGDEDGWVSTTGTLVGAINATDSANPTVPYAGFDWDNADAAMAIAGVTRNGVTIAAGAANLAYHGAFGQGQFTTDPDAFYNGGHFNLGSLTLTGLTPGQPYLLQIMGNDARGTDGRWTVFGDGTQSAEDSTTAGTAGAVLLRTDPGGAGSYVIGTFTADGTSQSIDIHGARGAVDNLSSESTAQFNALQLRAIPEPASLALLALGCIGMLGTRRQA